MEGICRGIGASSWYSEWHVIVYVCVLTFVANTLYICRGCDFVANCASLPHAVVLGRGRNGDRSKWRWELRPVPAPSRELTLMNYLRGGTSEFSSGYISMDSWSYLLWQACFSRHAGASASTLAAQRKRMRRVIHSGTFVISIIILIYHAHCHYCDCSQNYNTLGSLYTKIIFWIITILRPFAKALNAMEFSKASQNLYTFCKKWSFIFRCQTIQT